MADILNARDLVCTQEQFLQLVKVIQTLDLTQAVERHVQNSTQSTNQIIKSHRVHAGQHKRHPQLLQSYSTALVTCTSSNQLTH
jgi:hypothetical protein